MVFGIFIFRCPCWDGRDLLWLQRCASWLFEQWLFKLHFFCTYRFSYDFLVGWMVCLLSLILKPFSSRVSFSERIFLDPFLHATSIETFAHGWCMHETVSNMLCKPNLHFCGSQIMARTKVEKKGGRWDLVFPYCSVSWFFKSWTFIVWSQCV